MANIGLPGLIIILVVALLLFGPKKLPELGRATGQTLKSFRDALNGKEKEEEKNLQKVNRSFLSADWKPVPCLSSFYFGSMTGFFL